MNNLSNTSFYRFVNSRILYVSTYSEELSGIAVWAGCAAGSDRGAPVIAGAAATGLMAAVVSADGY
jgi:hypothetical protein